MKKKLLFLCLICIFAWGCGTPVGNNETSKIEEITQSTPKQEQTEKESIEETTSLTPVKPTTTEQTTTKKETTTIPKKEYASVGQIVCGEDYEIALIYAKEYNIIGGEYYSDKPSEGKIFLSLFFEVKNVSKESKYFNNLYFEGYVDDYSVDNAFLFSEPDGFSSIGGELLPNKRSIGHITYEVSADWNTFEITYDDGFWVSHEQARFMLNKEDVSPSDYVFNSSIFEQYVLTEKATEKGIILSNSKWQITFIDCKEYSSVGTEYLQSVPNKGNEFVLFFLEAQNISSEDDYFNPLSFNIYVDGYLSESRIALLTDVDGYDSIGGDVAQGKKTKGYVAIEVSEKWKVIELAYSDGYSEESPILINITK